MKEVYVFIATAAALGCHSIVAADAAHLYDEYSKVFGFRLPATFRSPFTLTVANERALSVKDPAMSFGCSSYSGGENIAFRVREEQLNASVKPILVDYPSNAMCFIVFEDGETDVSEVKEAFDFSVPLEASLKIHDSIYGFVESMNVQATWSRVPDDVTMLFPTDSFNSSLKAVEHFQSTLKYLSQYSTDTFASFFWTSSHTSDMLSKAPPDLESDPAFNEDLRREKIWIMAAEVFNQQHIDSFNDWCGWSVAASKAVIREGKIVLPLDHLMAMHDKVLAKSCVAYLAAVFAQDNHVNHVAFTHRSALLNFRSRSIQQSAKVGSDSGSSPYTSQGLLGDNQIVAIADTGLDINSCYFYDPNGAVPFSDISAPVFDTQFRKVIQYTYGGASDTSDEPGGHGTHVSGTVAGSIAGADITTDGQYDGVAPNAKIAFMDLGVPGSGLFIPPMNQLYGDGYMAGARVHTNSWGSTFSGSGYYCSHDVDDTLYNNKDFMIFFAAGNSGAEGSDGSSTVTMDSSGKNVVSVGSSETTLDTPDINYVAWYSSKGPVYDNRIKPDLVAPGDQLLSANSNGNNGQSCGTTEKTGTSMASPSAAGSALLVRQYFMDTNAQFWTKKCRKSYRSCKDFTPSGALVKAILIHSSSTMTMYNGGGDRDVSLGSPPDYMQGFGRITLSNVLPLQGTNLFDLFVDDSSSLGENSQVGYAIRLGKKDVVMPIKVTLSWYDPPNVDGTTGQALLQNLDLKVVSPTNEVYHPNRRDTPDTINNNEHIVIDNPRKGVWKVTVSSQALPATGNQAFSLVITSAGNVVYA